MSIIHRSTLVACVAAVVIATPAVNAESCKPDQPWTHEHAAAKDDTLSTDIKGSRATTIHVCRDVDESGKDLKVTLMFDGNRKPMDLAQGDCEHKLARWAIARSVGPAQSNGTAATAKGVYRLCRD